MNSIEINNWQCEPDIARIVKSAFPSYKRKKVYVRASETITFSDMNWSGGTRSEYVACTAWRDVDYARASYHAFQMALNAPAGTTCSTPWTIVYID